MVAFLMAVAHWNVDFSRIGMFNISPPFFELLAIGFLLRGMRRGQVADYAGAGLALGLGFSFYVAFQVFFGVVGLFVLVQLVARSGYLRRHWMGLLVMALGGLLLIAPIADYAWADREVFFGRTRGLSIFVEVPREQWNSALLENSRKHLLMFNMQGDPNGRHGLPGEPLLAPVMGALFVLGVGLSLARIRQAQALLMLLGLGIPLLGGILSLTFEAPQASRTIPAQPATALLAALPIALLWQEWSATPLGRRYPRLFVWPLLALMGSLLIFEYTLFFERQRNDFAVWNAYSTSETIAAHIIAEEGADADVYLTQFFYNHPTVRFLARNAPSPRPLETTEHLPLHIAPSRDVILLTEAGRTAIVDEARLYYPNATIREYTPPFGGPNVLNYIRLRPADIAGIQGLQADYFAGEGWEGPPAQSRHENQVQAQWPQDAPLSLPFSVEWKGVLVADRYDRYRLILRAPGAAELYVDENLVATGEGGELAADLQLAKGNHALRLRAVGGAGALSLTWQVGGGGETPLPAWALNRAPVTNNGLLGRYYPNGDWQEPVAFAQIDPQINLYFHVLALPRPYTVEWSGKIAIPAAGFYRFGVESIDESEVYIDEQLLAVSRESNQYDEGGLELAQGLHDIRIRFGDRTNHTHINLYWTPPSGERAPIPSSLLFPPMGDYETIRVDELLAIAQPTGGALLESVVAGGQVARRPIDAQEMGLKLDRPRGVAVGADGRVYVTDAAQGELVILDGDGRLLDRVDRADVPLVEPVDVAIDSAGQLYVLDTQVAALFVFDSDGRFLRRYPTGAVPLGQSRGLGLDGQDRPWIALTSSGEVVGLDGDGQIVLRIPVATLVPDSQPVDVAIGPDGSVYVAAPGSAQLLRFDSRGALLQYWPIVPANTVDGPHLAVGNGGRIYLSQPEDGSLALLADPAGDLELLALPRPAGRPRKVVGIGVGGDGVVWSADSEGGVLLRIANE